VVICPGPNLAYFDKEVSLSEMVQHIYGKTSVITVTDRPNMFIKELKMYVDYLKNEILDTSGEMTVPQIKKLQSFKNNLLEGIAYYQNLFFSYKNIPNQLQNYLAEIDEIKIPELVKNA
jgi:hypothetical protein